MRTIFFATVLALGLSASAHAQTAAPTQASSAAHYSTADTDLGTLLDNPATKAILEKHIPGLTTNPQIEMARGMTLTAIQPYASDTVTDKALAAIDADLAKLPPPSNK